MTRPKGSITWCEVKQATLTKGAWTAESWWDLELECTHHVQRRVYRTGGVIRPAPAKVSCPECPKVPYMYVQIDQLARVGLTPGQVIAATALALTELGLAQTMAMVHGDRGYEEYVNHGGWVRFDSRGNPYVPVARSEKMIRSWLDSSQANGLD